jgi:cell wall-associated NlpC family hydrolase
MASIIELAANKFIGVPYVDKGKCMAGADCLGLVRMVTNEIFNKRLPDLDYEYYSSNDIAATSECYAASKDSFRQVNDPVLGCIVMFNVLGCPSHCGIYLGNGLFLHTLAGHDSAIERLMSVTWKNRIEGYYVF